MVKEEPMVRFYVLWGEEKDGPSDWAQWIEDAKEIFTLLGESPNQYSISTVELEDIKMRPIGGLSRKLANIKRKGHTIEGAEFDLLPDNFSDTLDFYASISRRKMTESIRKVGGLDFITCRIDLDYFQERGGVTPETERQILQLLEQNIIAQEGEVYETQDRYHGMSYIFNRKERWWTWMPDILMRFDGKEWKKV